LERGQAKEIQGMTTFNDKRGCAQPLDTLFFYEGGEPFGVALKKALARQDALDRFWFSRHPLRKFRARPLAAAERYVFSVVGALPVGSAALGYDGAAVVTIWGGKFWSIVPAAVVSKLCDLSESEILTAQTGTSRRFLQLVLAGHSDLADALSSRFHRGWCRG
jgi:hypothetical protein